MVAEFSKIRGRSGTKHSDLLSDHSCSAYDPDRACYGNSGFFCGSRSFCILQIYGNEVFRRNQGSFGWFLCLCELAIVLVTAALSVILILIDKGEG